MPDNAQLLRRYLDDHSEESFAEVVRAHVDFVHGCALRLVGGDVHLAEDVTQAVFIRMGRAAPALVEHPALKGWLYTTARHVAADAVRTERRRKAREEKAHAMSETLNRPGSEPNWEELRTVIDHALGRLSARDREAIFLRFYEGKDYAEIGARLSATAGAARHRVDRALEKMRATLAVRGVGSSVATLAAAMTAQAAVPAPAAVVSNVTSAAFAASKASSSAIAFFTLVSMNKIQTSLVVAALLGAFGFTAYEIRRVKTAEQDLMMTQSQLSLRTEVLAASRQKSTDAVQQTALLQQSVDQAPLNQAARTEPPRSTVNTLTKEQMAEAGRAFLQGHPEARALLVRYTRTQAIAGLAPFFKARGMTSEQIAAFQDAIEPSGEFIFGQSQPVAGFSMTLALSDQPISPEHRDERIRSVLGEDGFAAYRQFKEDSARLGPVRNTIEELAGELCWTAEPLTSTQADRLQQILAQNSPDFQAGKRVNLLKLDWDQISAQAQTVLTATQLRLLNENRQAFVNDRTINQAERAAEGEWLRAQRQKK